MIVIAGASGFVGGHLIDHLLAAGREVSCLARSEKAANALLARGCRVIRGDITQAETLKNILHPEDIVIHLVGIIEEQGSATFRSLHVQGTRNLVDESMRAGIRHFFYQSALGSDKTSWSGYLKTKAEAEEIVMQSGIPSTIFRPSLIIGPWDGFTRKMVDLIRLSPVIPIPGDGKARFQPIYIKDWVKCLESVLRAPQDFVSSYDLGGPEHLTYRQIVEKIAAALGTGKPIISMPMGIMKLSVGLLEGIKLKAPVSGDQLRLLEQDNICDLTAVKRYFGFTPVRFDDMLREFVR
jgi:uncharacterized protein YbjT (DUF2867 family)